VSMILYLRRASDDDIAELRVNPTKLSDFFFHPDAQSAGDIIDFDKAWQGIHFTLTGSEDYTDDDLGILLFNGEQIGEDMGYGPGWIVPNANVVRFHQALSKISDDEIRASYSPEKMVEVDIYHADGFADDPEEGLEYLMQTIPELRAFAEKCASSNSTVIGAIC
jgi:Domain of unknown function (DUF1877)